MPKHPKKPEAVFQPDYPTDQKHLQDDSWDKSDTWRKPRLKFIRKVGQKKKWPSET